MFETPRKVLVDITIIRRALQVLISKNVRTPTITVGLPYPFPHRDFARFSSIRLIRPYPVRASSRRETRRLRFIRPYGPDPTPSDYHLFPELKEHLDGQRYVKDDVLRFLKGSAAEFYDMGVQKSEHRLQKCVEKVGD